MKSKNSNATRVCILVYLVLLAAFLCHILIYTDISSFFHADEIGIRNDYSDGWMLDSGEVTDIDEVSAQGFGRGVAISKILPTVMSETDAICFSTSNLRFRVYVNDDLIYTFDTRKNITGTGDGISYHMIGLGSKDEGDTIRIEGETVFADGYGGRINDMQFGTEEQYRYYLIRSNIVGVTLSFLLVIFGIVIIVFFFGMSRRNTIMRPLWALGLAAILLGLWSICDTCIPQLLTGVTYGTRAIVYGILHLAGFPIIFFVNSVTRRKRSIYLYLSFATTVLGFGWLIFSRYVLGIDLHNMVVAIYSSYAVELLWLVIILADNEIYSRKKELRTELKYMYIGLGAFVLASFADMVRYVVGKKSSIGRGSLFRFGLAVFFLLLAFQIFDWWSREKKSLERDRFVNRLLQYIMDEMDPEDKIKKVLKYLCVELHADRAYIFEDMKDGTFDNTYEYCAEGVTPEIDNLKGLPYEGVIDVWYDEYKSGGHVLIYDIEKYREVSENMYNVLKPQGINTLVTGPLILEGKYIGFFGVDNPPPEAMTEISEIIRLLMFFLSELIARRDNQKKLIEYSYQDVLTGVGNRRAIKKFEHESLDTGKSYGFVMCDINGLKSVNDNEGHEAGDELIKSVASCLTEVFGHKNVYRMGGDEFAVYTYEERIEDLINKIEKVKNMVVQKGRHVAIGYSYAQGGDPDYRARKTEADNKMYDDKREFYSNGNDRRRGR